MKKLEDLYKRFIELIQSVIFIWSYPTLALTILAMFPSRALGFIFLAVWIFALIKNTDEKG